MDIIPNAVLKDPRAQQDKEKDHIHEDLFSGFPAVWSEKPKNSWRLTTQRNQDGSFSCVKQSSATAIETLLGKVISAAGYKLREDKTRGGMYLQNCGDIDYNTGTTLEIKAPSENMNDSQMDAIELPLFDIKITGYRTFSKIDIDSIAEAIQAYGNCILVFHSNPIEWQMTPKFVDGAPMTFGHAICAVDFTLINGVKSLICMDSAGQFSSPTGVRIITEDFLNKRCVGGMYYLGAKFVDPMLSPQLSLTTWQAFVKVLQSLFIIKPGSTMSNTGNYVALAGVVVMALNHFGINVLQSDVEAVIGSVVIVYGIVHQAVEHRKTLAAAGVK